MAYSTGNALTQSRAVGVAIALIFGVFMIYGVAFAGADVLHNAAHDVRHVFAFPCH
jgi:cobalt transporter subunit CbtB